MPATSKCRLCVLGIVYTHRSPSSPAKRERKHALCVFGQTGCIGLHEPRQRSATYLSNSTSWSTSFPLSFLFGSVQTLSRGAPRRFAGVHQTNHKRRVRALQEICAAGPLAKRQTSFVSQQDAAREARQERCVRCVIIETKLCRWRTGDKKYTAPHETSTNPYDDVIRVMYR